ncbi:MAG TPA: sugar transferase [Candidatus Obscuribacterales bacterium]
MTRILKRLFDFLAALVGLLILAPVLVAIALAIYLRMGSPIFFTQPRPGKDGRIFTFYKFRTMTMERDAEGNLLPDEQRLTSVGQFLRKTSLDEFPQLWNVLKGDMSLVGPRPLLVAYLQRYNPEQARRHHVKPGITGWAQVNGRNTLSWEDKFKLDIWYIDNWSLWLDLKILFLTLIKVLKREGISHVNHATMSEFQGSPPSIQ